MRLRNAIRFSFVVLALVLMTRYFVDNWTALKTQGWEFHPRSILFSAGLLWLATTSSIFAVRYTFQHIAQAKVGFWNVYKMINVTNIGRYIPGKVWSAVGLVYYAGEYGISARHATLAITATEISSKTSALLLGLGYFFFSSRFSKFLPGLVMLLILCVVAMHPSILDRVLNTAFRIFKKQPIKIEFGYWLILRITFIYIGVWLLHSLAFYVLVNGITRLPSTILPQFFTILPLCWVVGYLVLFAPGGIGVREGLLVIMLGEFMPHEVAVVIAIVQRIWFIVVEGVCFATALLVPRVKAQTPKALPAEEKR